MDRRSLTAHFFAYALLAFGCIVVRLARHCDLPARWKFNWVAVFAVYAAADELTQPLFRRHADPLDWVADMAGVLVIMLLVRPKRAGLTTED
jgi:VanZ family protein